MIKKLCHHGLGGPDIHAHVCPGGPGNGLTRRKSCHRTKYTQAVYMMVGSNMPAGPPGQRRREAKRHKQQNCGEPGNTEIHTSG